MADAGVDIVESGADVIENMLDGAAEPEKAAEELEQQDFDPNDIDEVEAEIPQESEDADEEADEADDSEDEDEDADEEEPEAQAEPGGKAQKRIRKLVAEKNELKAAQEAASKELEQFRYQQAYSQQQFEHQMALQKQQQEMQMQTLRAELDTIRSFKQKDEEADLSPVEKLERQAAARAEAAALAKMQEQLAPIQKWQKDQEALRQKQEQDAERLRIHQQFAVETEQARGEFLAGFAPEVAQNLAPRLDEFILTFSAAGGTRPQEAKAVAKKFLDDYADARDGARAAKRKAKVAKSQAAPKAKRVGRAGAVGTGQAERPSLAKLQSAGINDYLEWREMGFPNIP